MTAARTSPALSVAAALAVSLVAPAALASSSADELVRQARAHEAAQDEDVAASRYMDALAIEPRNADAWMGLAALRMKLAEFNEADIVYSAALERLPMLRAALEGRARARWAVGRRREAETDLEAYATVEGSAVALRELADWFGLDGRFPAQLATWRRLLATAVERLDEPSEREARRMVRALVIVVDGADPASSPVDPDATRLALAAIARRGG